MGCTEDAAADAIMVGIRRLEAEQRESSIVAGVPARREARGSP